MLEIEECIVVIILIKPALWNKIVILYVQMILPFINNNMSLLQCNTLTDVCIIYMHLNIAQSLEYNNSNQCTVVCIGINCDATNTINTDIYGSNSNIIQLQALLILMSFSQVSYFF